MSRGMEDATPLMESYHAFANKEYIAKTLTKFKVEYTPKDAETRGKTEIAYTFEPNGFYATLTRRIREHFGSTKENESITKNIKANKWWVFKVASLTALYLGSYVLAFFMNAPTLVSMVFAAFSGIMLIAVGMNAMHDGSHYAVGVRDSWKNHLSMRIWNAAAYWDPARWLYHHTIRHHAFTGDGILDPDTVHATPAVRKALDTDRNQFWGFPRFMAVERWFWALWATLIYTTVPGMYVMQIISYNILWPLWGTLWGMPIEKTKSMYDKYWWQYAISAMMIGAHVYKHNIFVTAAYFIAANITYALCIVPDHDTYDSAVENHLFEGRVDWGEIQVRHASDFGGQGFWGRCFTEVFGSINVQIAHHLYPSLNHIYLPEVAPIIQKTCAEFNIPYAVQGSIPEAVASFVKTVHRCMGPENQDLKKFE